MTDWVTTNREHHWHRVARLLRCPRRGDISCGGNRNCTRREHDQASAVESRLSDPFQAFGDVGLLGAHDRLHLNAGNRDLALRARSVAHRPFPENKNPRGCRHLSEEPEATRGLSAAAVTIDGNLIQLSSDGEVKPATRANRQECRFDTAQDVSPELPDELPSRNAPG